MTIVPAISYLAAIGVTGVVVVSPLFSLEVMGSVLPPEWLKGARGGMVFGLGATFHALLAIGWIVTAFHFFRWSFFDRGNVSAYLLGMGVAGAIFYALFGLADGFFAWQDRLFGFTFFGILLAGFFYLRAVVFGGATGLGNRIAFLAMGAASLLPGPVAFALNEIGAADFATIEVDAANERQLIVQLPIQSILARTPVKIGCDGYRSFHYPLVRVVSDNIHSLAIDPQMVAEPKGSVILVTKFSQSGWACSYEAEVFGKGEIVDVYVRIGGVFSSPQAKEEVRLTGCISEEVCR